MRDSASLNLSGAEILVIEMGDRGSKSVIFEMIIVKEQRVDGSSITLN